MDSDIKAVCFTGHRAIKDVDAVCKRLTELIGELIRDGYRTFLSGGARGFDALAAETVLQMKEKYPGIALNIILPFELPYEHEGGWTDAEIASHKSQLDRADSTVILQSGYKRGCYYLRDRYLVDNATLCIAYQTRNSGGTAYTVKYAKGRNIDIINIACKRRCKNF